MFTVDTIASIAEITAWCVFIKSFRLVSEIQSQLRLKGKNYFMTTSSRNTLCLEVVLHLSSNQCYNNFFSWGSYNRCELILCNPDLC